MRRKNEYILCKQIATYLRYQHPKIIFHYDYAGLNLSKAQSGMMKEIQGVKSFPDLFVAKPMKPFAGLFLELKADGNSPYLKDGKTLKADDHVKAQAVTLGRLREAGYAAFFSVGFEETKTNIDTYLKNI